MQIKVTRQVLEALAGEARAAHPRECCGVLLGSAAHIAAILPAANVHPAAHTHFTIDPQTLINAHRAARAGGPEVLGYYHSHPDGRAQPSATDRDQAPGDGRIWAIIAADNITFWRDAANGFMPLPYIATAP